jgi:hypothetical protein
MFWFLLWVLGGPLRHRRHGWRGEFGTEATGLPSS